MNGEGNREWKHGTYRWRVEAHIVETRDDEPRKMDLLFTVAMCLRSPIADSTHRNRMIECCGSKGRYPKAGWWRRQVGGLEFEGSLPQSRIVRRVGRGLGFENSLSQSGIMRRGG